MIPRCPACQQPKIFAYSGSGILGPISACQINFATSTGQWKPCWTHVLLGHVLLVQAEVRAYFSCHFLLFWSPLICLLDFPPPQRLCNQHRTADASPDSGAF